MLTTFVVQVEDRPGVLNRVASLFRRRGFNIESLTVGHTEKRGLSRMTVVVDTDSSGAARLEANLYKLVHVVRVENVSNVPAVFRDLAIVKVVTTPETRAEIMQLAHVFRARVLDVNQHTMLLEATGAEDKIDGFVEVLRGYGIVEMARTGRVAVTRGMPAEIDNTGRVQDTHFEDDNVSYSV